MPWYYWIGPLMVWIAFYVGRRQGRAEGFAGSAQECFDIGASTRRLCEGIGGDSSKATVSITKYGHEVYFDATTATMRASN